MYEKIQETASWLKAKMTTKPETAIILGTGLGQLATEITDSYEFSYKDIPNFPVSTVEGHAGKLIFGKLGGKDINLNTINIEKYEQQISKSDNTISRKFEDNNTRSIKDIYVSNLKADISAKLKEKGYEIDTSDIQIKDDENYTIEKITLKLIKMEQKQGKNNEIVINTVEIGNTISQKDSKTLSDDEEQEVKDYISETYDIDKKNINIS